jgi:hypothetical protein
VRRIGVVVALLLGISLVGTSVRASPRWDDIDTDYRLRPLRAGLFCGLRSGDTVEDPSGYYGATLVGTEHPGTAEATWWFQSNPSFDFLVTGTTRIKIVEVDIAQVDVGELLFGSGAVVFTGPQITETRPGPRNNLVECEYLGWWDDDRVGTVEYWIGTVIVHVPGGIPEIPPLPACWPFCYQG